MKHILNSYRFNTYGICSIVVILALFMLGSLVYQQSQTGRHVVKNGEIAALSSLSALSGQPLRFVANEGQAGSHAKFHVQGAGHTVLFYEDKVVLRRNESETVNNEIVLQFVGANQSPAVEGIGILPGVAHFYKGRNPDQWHIDVPTYKSVVYEELYPGIDMAYIGDEGQLESEFYVSPGVDYHQIRLNYQGIRSTVIRDDGALVIETELWKVDREGSLCVSGHRGVQTRS